MYTEQAEKCLLVWPLLSNLVGLITVNEPWASFLTWWRVDERNFHPGGLSGPLELRQVGLVRPGRLYCLETGRRSCVYPLAEVRELREEPRDVGTEPERSHFLTPTLSATKTAAMSFVLSARASTRKRDVPVSKLSYI